MERIGVEKSKKIIDEADLIMLVFDNNTPLNDNDKELLELTKNKNSKKDKIIIKVYVSYTDIFNFWDKENKV